MATTARAIGSLFPEILPSGSILTQEEHRFVSSLIAKARTSSQSGGALAQSIARLTGEIVAERVYGDLAKDVERQLMEQALHASGPTYVQRGGTPPAPIPPAPTPGTAPHGPNKSFSAAFPLSSSFSSTDGSVEEFPEMSPAKCVVLEEFLAPEELQSLMRDVLQREMEFQISEVIAPGVSSGTVDFESRRSHVLMDLGRHRDVILQRLQTWLPRAIQKLGLQPFSQAKAEAQITASNHGDFFRCHSDNGHEEIKSREITFVYFFHREPKSFQGGELRLYDSRLENGAYVATENYRTIVPRQNQIVLFPSSVVHEITPVECSSSAFADSRFTINGWLHR